MAPPEVLPEDMGADEEEVPAEEEAAQVPFLSSPSLSVSPSSDFHGLTEPLRRVHDYSDTEHEDLDG